ncbi:6-hydroxymethylpterin diphosphokinase MptE-like protein [Geotalea toluenoxydans]
MKKIIINVAKTLYSVIRAVKNCGNDKFLQLDNLTKKDLCVLGNGPSLNHNLINNIDFITSRVSICVNDFISSDFFYTIKPSYYLLLDPAYWRHDSISEYIEIRNSIFNRLNQNVDWCLTIIIPSIGKKELDWESIFDQNKNLKVAFINTTPISGYECVRHFLYKYQFGMPHAQNVLVAALFIGINLGFKNIFLLGADHSWHEELFVNNDNVACMKDRHFYDNGEVKGVPFPMYHDSSEIPKLHIIFDAFAKMFEGYHYIENYANYRGVQIYNASNKSYIDAFKRCAI